MQGIIAKNPGYSSNEYRLQELGALDFYMMESERAGGLITEELKAQAATSIGRTVSIPALKYNGNVQVSSTRSCVIPCNPSTSEMVAVNFVYLGVGFCMVPDAYMNNYIGYLEDFDHQYKGVAEALGNALDALCVTDLEAYKTQVIKNKLNYAFTGNTVQVPWNKRFEILGHLRVMQRSNRYTGQLHNIGSFGLQALIGDEEELGQANAINKQLQYRNYINHYSENVVDAAGQIATFFNVESGNVGLLFRFDRAAINNRKANDHEMSVVTMPLLNIPASAHYYTEWGDQSATVGEATADMVCDLKEYFGFGVHVAVLHKYNSDPATIPTPDIKVQIAGTEDDAGGIPVNITNIVRTQEVTP